MTEKVRPDERAEVDEPRDRKVRNERDTPPIREEDDGEEGKGPHRAREKDEGGYTEGKRKG